MKDHIDQDLIRLDPIRDEDLPHALDDPEAIALLTAILYPQPRVNAARSRRSQRVWLGAWTAAAAALVAILLVVTLASSRSSKLNTAPLNTAPTSIRLVSFSKQGDTIVAEITHPAAASAELSAAFAAFGLDINVTAEPVSPSLVGTIVYSDVEEIKPLESGHCIGGGITCEVGLVIPSDFTGHANVVVGRGASAGESFSSSADVFGVGEVLHCSGALGVSTAEAAVIAKAAGLSVDWMKDGIHNEGSQAPDGYVVDGIALSPTTARLDTMAQLPNTSEFANYEKTANTGC